MKEDALLHVHLFTRYTITCYIHQWCLENERGNTRVALVILEEECACDMDSTAICMCSFAKHKCNLYTHVYYIKLVCTLK